MRSIDDVDENVLKITPKPLDTLSQNHQNQNFSDHEDQAPSTGIQINKLQDMTSLVDSNGVDCFDHYSRSEEDEFYNQHVDFPNGQEFE